jgi:hypothetical protein
MQAQLDLGYIEASSHSRIHTDLPYDPNLTDYDSEIGGSAQDIKDNLSLPYKKGSAEYVSCFIEPFGQNDPMMSTKLAEYKYLVSRTDLENNISFAKWDDTYGLYNNAVTTVWMRGASEIGGPTPAATLDAIFDSVVAVNGIYHFWFHPIHIDWSPQGDPLQHLKHIKDKNNIWYVGFGNLYAYRYVHERGNVNVSAVNGSIGSRGKAVFDFFDDFNNSDKDLLNWDLGNTQVIETQGELKISGAGAMRRNFDTFSLDHKIIEYQMKVDNIASEASDFWYSDSINYSTNRKWAILVGTGGKLLIYSIQNGAWALRAQSAAGTINVGTTYDLRISDAGNNFLVELFNSDWSGILYSSGYISRDPGGSYFHIHNNKSATWYMDNFRIRQYTTIEPIITVGTVKIFLPLITR